MDRAWVEGLRVTVPVLVVKFRNTASSFQVQL